MPVVTDSSVSQMGISAERTKLFINEKRAVLRVVAQQQ